MFCFLMVGPPTEFRPFTPATACIVFCAEADCKLLHVRTPYTQTEKTVTVAMYKHANLQNNKRPVIETAQSCSKCTLIPVGKNWRLESLCRDGTCPLYWRWWTGECDSSTQMRGGWQLTAQCKTAGWLNLCPPTSAIFCKPCSPLYLTTAAWSVAKVLHKNWPTKTDFEGKRFYTGRLKRFTLQAVQTMPLSLTTFWSRRKMRSLSIIYYLQIIKSDKYQLLGASARHTRRSCLCGQIISGAFQGADFYQCTSILISTPDLSCRYWSLLQQCDLQVLVDKK